MFDSILKKFKEAAVSVLPVAALVVILNLLPFVNVTLDSGELISFLVSAFFLILGIAMFSLGADLAMTEMGEHIGAGLTKSRNIKLLVSVCFLMGVLITVAEPDLSVLADQVHPGINGTLLIVAVGVGVGLFLFLSVLKIVFKKQLSLMQTFGTIDKIMRASVEELAKADGIGEELAKKIYKFFKEEL